MADPVEPPRWHESPSIEERVATAEKRLNTQSLMLTAIAAKLGLSLPEPKEGGEDAR